ncbi:hypothetical protein [Desulfosporosinus sp. BICA1-9]|uniref:hypothetical protein n=1 Tax=Desulfosporosinus sp. BICA1-9 TaxID=1531958 RepID=UPI00054C3229|nr:hypothetical protein [Desulfosporosinus sp. BICA1-9]KJS46458.1 MAG: hypothetical protein VR66_25280 [Peptococcaceae bacterium BRH_c23]KJS49979.1 MAG: hypothetical protein VR66_05485 [Peptococcaceae bacterium BRH_c23]KJS79189.1 MAG: hypothetical protein JL57_30235 [Desulfosporosinus sp. BICA1-9]HBW37600.1 hypothetical protein [Desulfosporosinus sp.]
MKENFKTFLSAGIPFGIIMGVIVGIVTNCYVGIVVGTFLGLIFGLLISIFDKKITWSKPLTWNDAFLGNLEY